MLVVLTVDEDGLMGMRGGRETTTRGLLGGAMVVLVVLGEYRYYCMVVVVSQLKHPDELLLLDDTPKTAKTHQLGAIFRRCHDRYLSTTTNLPVISSPELYTFEKILPFGSNRISDCDYFDLNVYMATEPRIPAITSLKSCSFCLSVKFQFISSI
jgi:hypothetical protein